MSNLQLNYTSLNWNISRNVNMINICHTIMLVTIIYLLEQSFKRL